MVKKFTLMFLLGIFGLFSTNLFAQEDATIDPSQIKFWIGEGESEAVFIVNWAEPDTALAWGYRFVGENVIMKTMMDDIAAADYRFSYEGGSFINDLHFNDGVLDLSLVEQGWLTYLINGESTWDLYNEALVGNGEYVKIGDTHCGTMIDPENWIYVYEKEVAPVYPLGEEAMIDPSEIVYWIGEGENEAVFCVNWNEPNVALAWGYRFSGESVTVENVMDAIAEADGRFSYEGAGGMVNEITFDEYDTHYALAGMWWLYNINGYMAWYGYNEQTVVNGDFIKFGDESCATEIAQWTYVWTTPVQPVTIWNAVEEVEASALSVYPNPASEVLYVNAENVISVEIYDILGHNVLTSTESYIELRGLEAGIYFVKVRSDNAMKTTKLVVK
ncbi:MAG: T9SS type A sorting domain-containing protein [Bacteroidales bacterium]|nr:T9SS type A sorting domain-containing protein [Bacteroidales bacterium]MBO7528341.1 T9SS type A sorting domain-containing protein [Bacteroidales bacterium]